MGGLDTILTNIIKFLNDVLVPFLVAMAALVFFFNIARYFIIGAADSEAQEKAKSLAMWGITAFVIIVSFWGIVNLMVNGLGFGGQKGITPDYIQSGGVKSSESGPSGSSITIPSNSGPLPQE